MKNFLLTLCFALLVHVTFAANTSDSMKTCFSKLQVNEAAVQSLQHENKLLKSEISTLNSIITAQSSDIDSLETVVAETNDNVSALADSLNINVTSTRQQIQTNSDSINATIAKKSQTGIWIFVALALIVAVIAFIFGKLLAKRGNEVASLAAKADKLNEEIVNQLSSQMSEMQTLTKQIGTISAITDGGSTDTEQKLITTLADRITFMEMTLYKMDSSVRGHKQLSKSIKQMKDNLLANGYELVDMLGNDYHDGMKVTANFVEDENLPEGKQIITGIIKPQINYQGKMIQSAQITVSQNL